MFALRPRLPQPPTSLSHPSQLLARLFSTSLPHRARSTHNALDHAHAFLPPYPYPRQYWYKKANFGLFGGSRVRFGNTVSDKTETKNRRKWLPNIHSKKLYSVALGRHIRIKVQVRVLRTIDKVGGLDEYLLGEKAQRVKELGMGGWALRWRVMRSKVGRARFDEEARQLGLVKEKGGLLGMARTVQLVSEEDGENVPEETLSRREKEIDRLLDVDDAAARRGEEGGVEIGDVTERSAEVPGVRVRRGSRW